MSTNESDTSPIEGHDDPDDPLTVDQLRTELTEGEYTADEILDALTYEETHEDRDGAAQAFENAFDNKTAEPDQPDASPAPAVTTATTGGVAAAEAAAEAAANDGGDDLTELTGVGPQTADALSEAGYGSLAAIREAATEDLAAVEYVSENDAESFHDQLNARDPSMSSPAAEATAEATYEREGGADSTSEADAAGRAAEERTDGTRSTTPDVMTAMDVSVDDADENGQVASRRVYDGGGATEAGVPGVILPAPERDTAPEAVRVFFAKRQGIGGSPTPYSVGVHEIPYTRQVKNQLETENNRLRLDVSDPLHPEHDDEEGEEVAG